MSEIKLVVKQIILNIKSMFSNWFNIALILLIPIIILTLPVFFIPLNYSFSIVFCIISSITSFIVYERVSYSFKKSTLYNNQKLSKNNKWIYNLSTIFTMILIVWSVVLFSVLILIILNNFDLLLDDYLKNKREEKFNLYKTPWLFFIYQLTLLTLVFFSLSYFIEKVAISSKSYYSSLISLLILIIIFGGAFNNYFLTPQRYVDEKNNKVFNYAIFNYPGHESIFPSYIFAPSLLFPFFAPAQMMIAIGNITHFHYDSNINEWVHKVSKWNNFSPWLWEKKSYMQLLDPAIQSPVWKWNILWIVPYFHIIGWFLLGRLLDKKR